MTRLDELAFMYTGIVTKLEQLRSLEGVAQRVYNLEICLRQVEEEMCAILEMERRK